MTTRLKRWTSRVAVLVVLLCGFSTASFSQQLETVNQYRMGFEMDWSLVKGLKMSVEPQLRFGEKFKLENYNLDVGLRYKAYDFIYVSGTYRLIVDPNDEQPALTDHRYDFSVTARDKFGRFTPSFRIMYSNYIDEDITDEQFMKYRAMVKYDIPDCKITPYLSAELVQELDEGLIYKQRYAAGADYKVKKNRYLNLEYKLDYYSLKYKNRHIFSLGYKFNF
ncbi:MAG: DUF2490 domain-containing protein [Rikenellaceae bacterium]